MATISHKTLSGSQLHEPKGIGSATVGTAYIADGAGSGSWQIQRSLGRGYIDGCTLSNAAGDTTNDIAIAAGVCRDSTNTVDIAVAAMATGKRLDANWAAGDTNGMRNSAAAITNTTYHIYAVAKADGTQDIYAHTSTTVATVITALQAESGGASYLYARRLGSITRVSAAITLFVQRGNYVEFTTPVNDAITTPGTGGNTKALSLVPTGLALQAQVAHNGNVVYASALTQTNTAASGNLSTAGGTPGATAGVVLVWTDTSATIRVRTSDGATTINIIALGYFDLRGRDV